MKKLLILPMFLIFFTLSFSQVPFFLTPPNVYITESGYSGNCIQSLASSPTSGHLVANAFWDESWTLRFYVVNDSVFNRTGGFLSLLNGYTTTTDIHGQSSQYLPWIALNSDLVIIPKPGACKHMYVIYSIPGTVFSAAVLFTEVDISSGTPSVVSISYAPGTSPNALVNLGTLPTSYLAGTEGSPAVCLAASKPYDSNDDRILYVVGGDNNVYSVPITSSGFGTASNIASTTQQGQWIGQMKLRNDGQMLAWAETEVLSGSPILYELSVTSSGSSSGSPVPHPLPSGVTRVNGLEFLDGTDGALILSTDNGLYSFYVSGGTDHFTQIVSGDYQKSQINCDVNGYFYLVNNAGILKKVSNTFTGGVPAFTITDANNSGYPTCTVYSNNPGNFDGGTQQFSPIYTLPNEVDGDNYSYFTGVNQTTCNFQINSVAPTSVCANIQQVYNCIPITLSNLSTGAASYTLTVNSINGTCGIVSGSGLLTYSSGTISTLPTDLLNMGGTNGTWLASHPGSYVVTVTANNACGDNSTVSTYIKVNASPGATGAVLGINNPNTGVVCTTGVINNPCILCSGSPTMNIASSTGTITYYSKTVYQNISGSWVLQYASGNIATSGVSGLTGIYVGCNSTYVNCSTSTAWTVGGQYYVTVTVGNACGNSSNTKYFNYESCKSGGATAINDVDTISTFSTFPNPFTDKVDFKLSVNRGTQISIRLFDLTGRLVKETASKYYNEGAHLTILETGDLSTGVYMYQLIADDKTYTGKLVKTQ